MNGTDPAVPATLNCLDKDWIVGGISQCVAQTHDCAADSLLEIHKDIRRPERLAQLLTCNDLPGTCQQDRQHAERQILQTDLDSVPAEFAGHEISLEHTEPNRRWMNLCGTHNRIFATASAESNI